VSECVDLRTPKSLGGQGRFLGGRLAMESKVYPPCDWHVLVHLDEVAAVRQVLHPLLRLHDAHAHVVHSLRHGFTCSCSCCSSLSGFHCLLSRGPWAIVLGCCSRGLDALLDASSMLFCNLRAWRITHNYAGGVLQYQHGKFDFMLAITIKTEKYGQP